MRSLLTPIPHLGRTYGELDILFERKVPARKFKHSVVDMYRGDSLVVVPGKGDEEEQYGAEGVEKIKKV